jgi:tetratricopeptide (TPR) repeat protein
MTISTEYCLGNNARQQGLYDQAIERLGRVLEARRRMYGSDDDWTLAAIGDLAMAHWQRGDIADAEKLAEEQLNTARRLFSSNDIRLIRAEQSLVRIPSVNRTHDDIRVVREKTLAAFRVAYGNEHRKTLEAMRELASTYAALGQDELASQLVEESKQASAPK